MHVPYSASALLMLLPACAGRDYRQDMRELVQALAAYARERQPGFIVVPQNGQELATLDGEPGGEPAADYLAAIDGQGREDLFYGYDADDEPTPAWAREEWLPFLQLERERGVSVLAIDYCSTPEHVDESYARADELGFVAFAADHRELDDLPPYPERPHAENDEPVERLAEARNFLYLLEPSPFGSRQAYLDALAATTYDLFVLDAFYEDEGMLAPGELQRLQRKPSGARRLVLAYLSIGEAEDYRDYWDPAWDEDPPSWLLDENPDWPGDYLVAYWDPGWQAVLYGSEDAYLDRILAAGFDGVYLDIVDAFERFED